MRVDNIRGMHKGGHPRDDAQQSYMMYLVSTTRGDRLTPARSTSEAWMQVQDMGYQVESVSKYMSISPWGVQ